MAWTQRYGDGAAPVVAAAVAPTTPALTADDPVMAYMPEYEAMPNSSMRKIIATRLTGSARDIPHFNVTVDVEIDELLRVRKQLNSRDGADYKISVNDFIIKAVALTLKLQPDCNVTYTDEAILKFKRQDVAMAVAIDGGLITPIIHDAGNKGLRAISETAKELAEKARHGKLVPEAKEAHDRGVWLDTAHGRMNFTFDVAEKVLDGDINHGLQITAV